MNNSKQEQILQALLTSSTVREASRSSGIPEATIYKYLKKPEFKRLYKEQKAELINQATGYLQSITAQAVETIKEIADDTEINPQTRLTACRSILEYSIKLTETNDILQRLEALEAVAEDG